MATTDRRARVLLAVSAVVLGLGVLDLALLDGAALTLADAGLGPRTALLLLGSLALPGSLLLGWHLGRRRLAAVRPAAGRPSPPDRTALPATALLLRQQARHHTGTILALRL